MKIDKSLVTAVKGLIYRDKLKPEQLQTLETALANPQTDSKYWKLIFDGRGVNEATSLGLYNTHMVRLLTLQAMVIPDTLPEFLRWMAKRGKEDDHYQVSAKFQGAVRKVLVQLGGQALLSRIYEGTRFIIPQLLDYPELLEPTVWLLKINEGLWSYCYHQQLKEEIDHDLNLMPNYTRRKQQHFPFKLMDYPQWKIIFQDLKIRWMSHRYVEQLKYQNLAELFGNLGDYKLAAFFYQVGTGTVPKIIFYKVSSKRHYDKVYEMVIKKNIGFLEAALVNTAVSIVKVGETIVPIIFVLPLMVISFCLGFFIGTILPDNKEYAVEPHFIPTVNSTPSPSPSQMP